MTKNYPIVKILWLDSYASLEDVKDENYCQESVGWLVDQNSRYYILSQNLADGLPNNPMMYIIKKNVMKKCNLTYGNVSRVKK